jgi:hypothetical protein
LSTDSSFRFERGIDPNITIYALKQAALLIKELAGGTVSMEISDNYPAPIADFKVDLKYAYVDSLIGKEIPADTVKSPIANPWLTTTELRTLNTIAPEIVEFRRTVAVAWCAYSHVTQLRNWLPDEVGGICWFSVDNPGQSPRIPIFCGTTELPESFSICGQKTYNPDCILWQFRRANRLATIQWQSTKDGFNEKILKHEENAVNGIPQATVSPAVLNAYTEYV